MVGVGKADGIVAVLDEPPHLSPDALRSFDFAAVDDVVIERSVKLGERAGVLGLAVVHDHVPHQGPDADGAGIVGHNIPGTVERRVVRRVGGDEAVLPEPSTIEYERPCRRTPAESISRLSHGTPPAGSRLIVRAKRSFRRAPGNCGGAISTGSDLSNDGANGLSRNTVSVVLSTIWGV